MKRAATPTRIDKTGKPPPNRREHSSAMKAQKTPDRFAAMVLVNPVVLPPAAKKQPQETIPAQTGSAATPKATYVQPAMRIPILMASATSTSISHLLEGDCKSLSGRVEAHRRDRGRNVSLGSAEWVYATASRGGHQGPHLT